MVAGPLLLVSFHYSKVDNAASMMAAIHLLAVDDFGCMVLALQLVMKDSFYASICRTCSKEIAKNHSAF